MKRIRSFAAVFAFVSVIFCTSAVAAFPDKPITVICPWTAGGGTDMILRALSKEAEKFLGQPINVINQTGSGGAAGHNAIRTAAPDGYSLGMITPEINSLPPQGLVSFTWRDFDPLMLINTDPAALTVRTDAPYSTLRAFVDYAKAHPNEITIGSSSPGSSWHIAAGLAAEKTGTNLRHVAYNGAQPAVTALVNGHIKAVAVSVAEVRSQVQAKNLKILGIMSSARDKIFPNVPTFKEQGFNVEYYAWRGLALPKGVPAENRAKIFDAFKKAFESKEFQEFTAQASLNLTYQDSAEFAGFLDRDLKEVTNVMQHLGLAKK